jgi:hypothetical protein
VHRNDRVHPLQNRVTPFGEIVALPGRGTLMGNRGILHDDYGRIVRAWQCRRWIACVTQFRGRHREVMRPHSYTELFFLDEASALSAGHRPCKECRYADYRRFQDLWKTCFGDPANADAMDAKLHAERLQDCHKRIHDAFTDLPNGTFVDFDGAAWLIHGDELLAWTDSGYAERQARPTRGRARVLTPPSIVTLLRHGYAFALHPSAAGG